MDLGSFLAVAAFLLLAWEASRQNRSAGLMLVGLAVLVAAVVVSLTEGRGLLARAGSFFFDLGIGFLAAWLLFTLRKKGGLPFFAIGVMLLLVATGISLLKGRGSPDQNASLLLELGPDDTPHEVEPLLAELGLSFAKAFPGVTLREDEDLAQVYLISGNTEKLKKAMDRLRLDSENVDHIAWNGVVSLSPVTGDRDVVFETSSRVIANDPLVDSQWGFQAVHGHEAHELLRDLTPKRRAIVAIVDTGVDSNHEDIKGISQGPILDDAHGHGTHCAGVAGAVANNKVGIASLNWEGRFVDVRAYRALASSGAGTHESIAQAVIDAARDGADVLSISLGDQSGVAPRVITEAVAYARRKGCILVASAGNAGMDAGGHMPSNIDGVIAVAAVDQSLNKAAFSNTTRSITMPLSAPGVQVMSLAPGNRYVPMNGTSMATPFVAGLIGILRSFEPELTTEEVYDLLHETGTRTASGQDIGRLINAEAALRQVL